MEDGKLEIQLSRRSDSPVGNRAFGSGGGFGETLILRHKEVHNFFFVPFREQPIYSTRAHVFQIDPNTKKNWLPSSKHAVTVSYFYDSTRNVYRIISLDGTKVRSASLTPTALVVGPPAWISLVFSRCIHCVGFFPLLWLWSSRQEAPLTANNPCEV